MLQRLRKELRAFRKESEHIPQHLLIENYPYMRSLARTNALDFVNAHNLQGLNEHYFRYAFGATCFADVKEASALFYLGVLFPLIVKTHMADLSGTYEKLTSGISNRIHYGKVVAVTRRGDTRFRVKIAGQQDWLAKHVIFSAPYHNTGKIYPVPASAHMKPATVMYVRGRKKPPYADKHFILLDPATSSVSLIWSQHGDKDLLLCLQPEPDLDPFYSEYKVLQKVDWKTAVVLSNEEWLPMNFEPNLYLAGDQNICGLEDSFLSGRCAANQIIENG